MEQKIRQLEMDFLRQENKLYFLSQSVDCASNLNNHRMKSCNQKPNRTDDINSFPSDSQNQNCNYESDDELFTCTRSDEVDDSSACNNQGNDSFLDKDRLPQNVPPPQPPKGRQKTNFQKVKNNQIKRLSKQVETLKSSVMSHPLQQRLQPVHPMYLRPPNLIHPNYRTPFRIVPAMNNLQMNQQFHFQPSQNRPPFVRPILRIPF